MSPREAAHWRFNARCFSKWLWLCSVVGGGEGKGLSILIVMIARAGEVAGRAAGEFGFRTNAVTKAGGFFLSVDG